MSRLKNYQEILQKKYNIKLFLYPYTPDYRLNVGYLCSCGKICHSTFQQLYNFGTNCEHCLKGKGGILFNLKKTLELNNIDYEEDFEIFDGDTQGGIVDLMFISDLYIPKLKLMIDIKDIDNDPNSNSKDFEAIKKVFNTCQDRKLAYCKENDIKYVIIDLNKEENNLKEITRVISNAK